MSPGFDNPDTVIPGGEKPKNSNPGKKTKTEAFLNKTKKMNDSQFAKYMLENINKKKLIGENAESKTQSIHESAKLVVENKHALSRFVREIKRLGGFNALCNEMLQHPELYASLNEAIEGASAGQKVQRRLLDLIERTTKPRVTASPSNVTAPNGMPNSGGMNQMGGMPQMGMGSMGGMPSPTQPEMSMPNMPNVDHLDMDMASDEDDEDEDHLDGEEGDEEEGEGEGEGEGEEEEGGEDMDDMDEMPPEFAKHGMKPLDKKAMTNMQNQNWPNKPQM